MATTRSTKKNTARSRASDKDKAEAPKGRKTAAERVAEAHPDAPIIMMDPEKIEPAPWNKRQIREQAPSFIRFQASINKRGVLQNGIVRPHPDEAKRKAGIHQMLGGHRRRIAAIRARRRMPVMVIECDDSEAKEITWLENAERENLRPVEEALLVADMLADELTPAEVGRKINRDEAWVMRRAKLAELEPEWIAEWEKEEDEEGATPIASFKIAHMEIVAALHPEVRSELLQKLQQPGAQPQGSPARFGEYVQRSVLFMLQTAPWIETDDPGLEPQAGACGKCPHRTGAQGKLFADMAVGDEEDRCLNARCFERKMNAWVDRQRAELTAKYGDTLVLLTPDRDQADGARYRHPWNTVPKAEADGGVPALHIEGSETGKVVWIDPAVRGAGSPTRTPKVRKVERDEEGKPTLESVQNATEDRIVKLDRQRKTFCVNHIFERLTGEAHKQPKVKAGEPMPPTVRVGDPAKRPSWWNVFALASVIGTSPKMWSDPADWHEFDTLLDLPESERNEKIADGMWEELLEVFRRRLKVQSGSSVEGPFADAVALGELLGTPPEQLWSLAKVAHPIPAGWSKDAEAVGIALTVPDEPLPAAGRANRDEDDEDDELELAEGVAIGDRLPDPDDGDLDPDTLRPASAERLPAPGETGF